MPDPTPEERTTELFRRRHGRPLQWAVVAEIRAAVAAERERTLFVYRYVRDRLESPSALYELTLLFGDAPADCGCREAACPHERQFPPSETEIIETIDTAIRRGGEGEDAGA